jgi:shikimate dehydrogenase
MTSPGLQEIVALLGCPAAGNPAQYLFERAIEAAGLDWRFVTCDVAVEDIAAAVAGLAALGLRGCLLSGPLREAALPFVTTASPAAAFSGGLTLIERSGSGLVGHVTDGRGIVEALRSHVDLARAGVLVAGADTTGRAAALELAAAGVTDIVVCDPDRARTDDLVAALEGVQAAAATPAAWDGGIVVPERVGAVIIGAAAGAAAFSGGWPDLVVADTVLAPRLSNAADEAARHGGCIVDGLEIHAARVAIDFRSLTGREADTDMLRDALDEFLSA